MKLLTTLFSAGILTCVMSSTAHANLISGYGAYAASSTNTSCPSYCNGDSTYHSDGGNNSHQASSDTTTGSMHGKAFASIIDGNYLPLLRVESYAGANTQGAATAYAVQHFTFTGSQAQTIDLNINLHGSVNNNNAGYSYNALSADIGILKGDYLDWLPDFATTYFELGMGLERMGYSHLGFLSGNDVNQPDTLSFNVDVGDSFFVISELNATSKNGSVDAWHTLSMSFNDPSNLVAATQQPSTSVPEPASWALLLIPMLYLAGKTRKRI